MRTDESPTDGSIVRESAWWRFGPPVAVWVVAQTAVMVMAARAGYDPWEPMTWNRWDSGLYLSIAERGPELFRCGTLIPNRQPDDWCGSAGWLPLYPLIVATVVAVSPVGLMWAAWLVPLVVHLGGLTMAWRVVSALPPVGRSRSLLTLLAIGVAPGMVWSHAMFPISLLLAIVWTGAYLLLTGRRRWAAAVFGLVAVTHSMGFALIPVVGLWLVWTGRRRIAGEVPSGLLLVLPGAALVVFQHLALGHWNANLLAVASYRHRIGAFPYITLRRVGQLVADVVPVGTRWPAAQEVLVVAVIVVAIGVLLVWRHRTDVPVQPVEVLLVVGGVAMWAALASFDGDVAFWRVAASVTPCLVAVRRLPVVVVGGLVVVSAAVAAQIASRFVLGLLY